MNQQLSVVVPVYGNETTLVELWDRVSATMRTMEGIDYELIFVDDASPDGSWNVIETLAAADANVVGIRLASNVGQLRASCAGVDAARGTVLVSMDADLEHPPEAIPRLLHAFSEGHDLVVAKRHGHASEWIRVVGSRTVNLLARALRLPVADVGSSFLACTPGVAAEMRRVVEHTGRQMLLPTVFAGALDPTVVEVELSTSTTSAYKLWRVVGLGAEFVAAELGPAAARRALPLSACVLALGLHAPWRRRALRWSASLAGLGLVGLAIPSAFTRDRDEPLYQVSQQVGRGLSPSSSAGDPVPSRPSTAKPGRRPAS